MHAKSFSRWMLIALVLSLSACATGKRLSDTDKLAIYNAHAGAPVRSFQYLGTGINSWTPIGDKAIAVWTKPSQAWLLDLYGPCQDISYSTAITVTNMQGRVSAGFDKVIVLGRNAINIPCTIQTIRPLDVKAIRSAEKTAREGQPALVDPSPAAVPPSDVPSAAGAPAASGT